MTKLLDFQFVNKCSQASLDAAIAWLESPVTKSNVASNANYATFEDGELGLEVFSRVCHASMGNYPVDPGKRDCVAFWTTTGLNKPGEKRYYEYLTEESFASEFILFKNANGFVVSADIPASLMQQIAIMSRHVRECPSYHKRFKELTSLGYSGDLVYPVVYNSYDGDDGTVVRDYSGSHRAWRLFSLRSYKLFMKGDFGKTFRDMVSRGEALEHFRYIGKITGGLSLCEMSYPQLRAGQDKDFIYCLYQDESYRLALSNYRKDSAKTETYRPPNPFSTQRLGTPPQPHEVTFKELRDFVLPYCAKEGIFNA